MYTRWTMDGEYYCLPVSVCVSSAMGSSIHIISLQFLFIQEIKFTFSLSVPLGGCGKGREEK